MGCRAVLLKLGLEKKGSTPLNWSRLVIAIFALFASAFNITFLFPFLPQMVKELGYEEEEKGYYVGLIASAFFIGRAVGSNLWGYLSDKKGRRPLLMICLLLTGVSTIIFGLSNSIEMAIGLRFATGSVNGMVGLVKTILYELSDDSNQGMAMSTISLAWGSGIVIGPLVGGYLCLPAAKYPSVFGETGFWARFPFLMPCLISAVICVFACVAVFFRLPETNSAASPMKGKNVLEEGEDDAPLKRSSSLDKNTLFVDVEGPDFIQSRSNLARILSADDVSSKPTRSPIYRPSNLMSRRMSASEPDIRVQDRKRLEMMRQSSAPAEQEEEEEEEEEEKEEEEEEREGKKTCGQRCCNNIFFKLMRTRKVLVVIVLYSLTSFSIIGWEEVFILFASTDRHLGGLSFSTNDLGAATGLMSIPLLTLQLFIFPRLERRFGAKTVGVGCSALLMILMALSPIIRILVDNEVALWIVLFLILAPLRIMTTSTFTAISLLVNNSVRPCHAGTINGLTVLFAAVARAIAPLFGGSGFAWSIVNDLPYPFDINFTFTVFSLVLLASACVNVFAPISLNKQNKGKQPVQEENGRNSEKKKLTNVDEMHDEDV